MSLFYAERGVKYFLIEFKLVKNVENTENDFSSSASNKVFVFVTQTFELEKEGFKL